MENLRYLALVVTEDENHHFHRNVHWQSVNALPEGDVLIKVQYSSLNYKDALSATGNRGVTKNYPHTPGIDAAGRVVKSTDSRWSVGDQVICTGYDLGMNTPGGFGQYIKVPSGWVVRKPDGLTLLETMQLGTAGFTAGLCVLGLQKNDIYPERGPILVTGATGGVGSIALMLLHKLGYETVAVTGKAAEHIFLGSLGVSAILTREELTADNEKVLLPARWAGVIDTVGGTMLASAIKGTGYDGVVASCGNAASGDLPLNVYPFILRGVHLLGIYSAQCPMPKRKLVWAQLATDWKIPQLSTLCRRIGLNQLDDAIRDMIAGEMKGRCVVDLEDVT